MIKVKLFLVAFDIWEDASEKIRNNEIWTTANVVLRSYLFLEGKWKL